MINSRNECEVNTGREQLVTLDWKSAATVKTSLARAVRHHTRLVIATAAVLVLGIAALVVGLQAHAAPSTPTLFGTLDTQPTTVAAEAGSSDVSMAMFEYNWASFEPSPGVFSSSYLATMKSELAAYKAAGMKVTLGLGLQNPPSWVPSLADGTYVDQTGAHSTEANFVFSAAVRQAAAAYLKQVAAYIPLSNFYAIRLASGGDGEMLYPGGGTYWAFDNAALTGKGLAAGMTPNPDPKWTPGTAGLSQAQIAAWVNWYVGGLNNVTNWQMQTLTGLGFNGYYETVTPGSGTRPDGLTQTEQQNLSNDGTTGVGAVWNLYYAMLPTKTNVIAYISSVADNSGGNDDCQSSDTTFPHLLDHGLLVRDPLDQRHRPPLRPRRRRREPRLRHPRQPQLLLHQHLLHRHDGHRHRPGPELRVPGLLLGPRHPPVGRHPAVLPLRQLHRPLRHLPQEPRPGRHPRRQQRRPGIPGHQRQRQQPQHLLAGSGLHRHPHPPPQPGRPVDRVILGLPESWGTRNQTIEVDGSANGTAWTTLAPAAAYTFTAGSNAIAIPVPAGTEDYLRLDISGNNVQGVPQIAEFVGLRQLNPPAPPGQIKWHPSLRPRHHHDRQLTWRQSCALPGIRPGRAQSGGVRVTPSNVKM